MKIIFVASLFLVAASIIAMGNNAPASAAQTQSASAPAALKKKNLRFARYCDQGQGLFSYFDGSTAASPPSNCLFELDENASMDNRTYVFVPLQKITHGYLITATQLPYQGGRADRNIDLVATVGEAFLDTNKILERGKKLDGYAYFVGSYKYTALDGFEKTVYSFKAYEPTLDEMKSMCLHSRALESFRTANETEEEFKNQVAVCVANSLEKAGKPIPKGQ